MQSHLIRVIEHPSRRTLRVNVQPETQTISVKDVAVNIGLDRTQALALARALTEAAQYLADLEPERSSKP